MGDSRQIMPKNKGIPMPWEIGDIILFLHNIRTMYTVFISHIWKSIRTFITVFFHKIVVLQQPGQRY